MGLDFIRKTSGKPYEKRWKAGLDKTLAPSLIDVRLSEGRRSLTADVTAPGSARLGATVVVQLAGTDLVVSDGHQQVGRVRKVPSDIVTVLNDQQGLATATVERIGAFGTAEIRLTK